MFRWLSNLFFRRKRAKCDPFLASLVQKSNESMAKQLDELPLSRQGYMTVDGRFWRYADDVTRTALQDGLPGLSARDVRAKFGGGNYLPKRSAATQIDTARVAAQQVPLRTTSEKRRVDPSRDSVSASSRSSDFVSTALEVAAIESIVDSFSGAGDSSSNFSDSSSSSDFVGGGGDFGGGGSSGDF